MAFIQNTILDLDDLLISIDSVQGVVRSFANATAAGTYEADGVTFTVGGGDPTLAGFLPGDTVKITGGNGNGIEFRVAEVTATTIVAMDAGTFSGVAGLDSTATVTFQKVANDIVITTGQNHGIDAKTKAGTATATANNSITTAAGSDFAATFAVGDLVLVTSDLNNHVLCEVSAADDTSITFVGTPLDAASSETSQFYIQKAIYVTVTHPEWATAPAGYTDRYLLKSGVGSTTALVLHAADPSLSAAQVLALDPGSTTNITNTTEETKGQAMEDDSAGVFTTPEIVINAPNKTFQLINDGDLFQGGQLGGGVQGQALYSFFKERWKEVAGLTKFDFPMLSITNEQFEFINGYTPADDTTRKMIRTAGWAERDANNVVRRQYSGIISLGELGQTDQPYFVQEDTPDAEIFETDFTGAVNEAVLNYLRIDNAAVNDVQFIGNQSYNFTNADFDDATANFDVLTSEISGDAFAVGDVITIANAEDDSNNGTYKITAVTTDSPEAGRTQFAVNDAEGAASFLGETLDAITVTRQAAITSTTTDLSVFVNGNVVTVANETTTNFNGTARVRDSGFNTATFLQVENISTVGGGAAWQTASQTTSAAAVTITMNQVNVFKIFVRERGKTYADAELADIGVTQMTYIVYRFPVSNATDLDINTTSDGAILGAGIQEVSSSESAANSGVTTVTTRNITVPSNDLQLVSSFNALKVDRQGGTTSDSGFGRFQGSVGRIITIEENSGDSNLPDSDLGDYTIVSYHTDVDPNGTADAGFDYLVLGGRAVSDDATNTAQPVVVGEPHGLYANAPMYLSLGAVQTAAFSGEYTVSEVTDSFVFTVPTRAGVPAGVTTETYTATVDGSASASLNWINYSGSENNTYISLQYLEDIYDGLYIWGTWFGPSLTSAVAEVNDASYAKNQFVGPTGQFASFVVGQYIYSFGNPVGGNDGVYKISAITDDGVNSIITVTAANGAELELANQGNAASVNIDTYYTVNQVVQSTSNSKWYRCRTAGQSTHEPNDSGGEFPGTAQPTESGTTIKWGGTDPNTGLEGNGPLYIYEGSFDVEGLDTTWSAYDTILDANSDNDVPTATKEVIYEWAQWALRQSTAVDTVSLGVSDGPTDDTTGRRIGKIADSLCGFVGSTLETAFGVYVEDISSVDINNVREYDYEGTGHTFPLEVQVTINFNDNLVADANAVFYAYYNVLAGSDLQPIAPAGSYNFGTNNAVQVKRVEAGVEYPVGNQVDNVVPNSGVYTFNYAYDSDLATLPTGAPGRQTSTDQSITVVAIGLQTGQYVKATGTITSNGLTISMVAPLERNYTDPVD